jgi:hypothetical protein
MDRMDAIDKTKDFIKICLYFSLLIPSSMFLFLIFSGMSVRLLFEKLLENNMEEFIIISIIKNKLL